LSRLASALITRDEAISSKERPMHFHEFQSFISEPQSFKEFSPFKEILNSFTIAKKPIFWIRLVCFAYICNEYLGLAGSSIGFEKRQYDLKKLLAVSKDSYTHTNIEKYRDVFQSLINMSL